MKGLSQLLVDSCFRTDDQSRVVCLPPSNWLGGRSYLVPSKPEEMRIRAFLRLFYLSHFYIMGLGYFLGFELASWTFHLSLLSGGGDLKRIGASLVAFLIPSALPDFILWRVFKKEFSAFTSDLKETPSPPVTRRPMLGWLALTIGVAVALAGIAVVFEIRPPR